MNGKMMKMVVVVVMMVGALVSLAVATMPPQCSPEVLEEIDNPKIREICHFLQKYADAVENPYSQGGAHFPLGLIDNGVKRQDMDHVFLRFGRRRR